MNNRNKLIQQADMALYELDLQRATILGLQKQLMRGE